MHKHIHTQVNRTQRTRRGVLPCVVCGKRWHCAHDWQNDFTPVTPAVVLDTSGLVRAPPNRHLQLSAVILFSVRCRLGDVRRDLWNVSGLQERCMNVKS